MLKYYILLYLAVILAAVGQIFLKIGANREGIRFLALYINPWVAIGLASMVGSMLLNLKGLHQVPLKDMAFILPSVYILVPLLAKIFLKEQYSKQTMMGTLIIFLGIVIFNLPW